MTAPNTTPEALRFTAQLREAVAAINAQFDRVLQAAGFVLWEAFTVGNQYNGNIGTPVDLGFAINSWWVTVGSDADAGAHPNPPAAGSKLNPRQAFDAAVVQVLGAKMGDVLVFANGAAYITRLEYQSHSKKAPNGWVRIAAAQWERIVTDVLQAMPPMAGTGAGRTA